MPVSIRVTGSFQSVVHKGSTGTSPATIPDVCKTPTPGGPVPMPYPNISQTMTLSSGTSTVKCDGAMGAIKGSKFSMSNGDQPGTLGGVKSNVFMKESTWISYAFDVKFDGKCVCRFTDKKFHNNENTVNLAGEFQTPRDARATLAQWVKDCDQSVPKSKNRKKKTCQKLGQDKHACMEAKIKDYNDKNPQADPPPPHPPPGHPEGERAYKRPPVPHDGKYVTGTGAPANSVAVKSAAMASAIADPANAGLTGKALGKAISKAIGKALGGKVYPDCAIHLGDGKKQFIDFKFPCPKGQPSGHKRGTRNKLSQGGRKTKMSKAQRDTYTSLGKGTGGAKQSISITPTGIY